VRLGTIRTASGTSAVLIEGDLATEIGASDVGVLLAAGELPGWTGRHILSHVGHNARALGRLAHWAATGEPAPMYRTQRPGSGDCFGARWDTGRLRSLVEAGQDALAAAFGKLGAGHWATEVVTAQGRHVTAVGFRPVRPAPSRALAIGAAFHHPELI